MATQVFKVEKFTLQDEEGNAGKEVTVTSLPIKYLREFMEIIKKMENEENELALSDILVEAAMYAVKVRNKDVTDEELETSLDLPTSMRIAEIAGGISLDPNQVNQAPTV